ncbi:hypothetical protein [Fischerella sp. PCC 9605]|uniref:hypothetical protein n=1 Tax=Fischerella sp. PCC 9605 TaxID=1173024 RepID=UPI00047B9BCD|nr:hypothetical protein [Fischerella sp. PCC 9605]
MSVPDVLYENAVLQVKLDLAPTCILNSDLIGTLTSRIVRHSELKDKLHMAPLPIEVEPKPIRVMRYERNQQNSAHCSRLGSVSRIV